MNERANFSVARVVAEHRGVYQVKNADGEYLARVTGKTMHEAKSREAYPVVGDWVTLSDISGEQATIQAILPRHSIIKRRYGQRDKSGEKHEVQIIATNIDAALIVESVGRDYSLNRFERYAALVRESDIQPVLVLNKIDLLTEEELQERLAELRERFVGVDILPTSTKTENGLAELRGYLQKDKTYCFLGSSGVGKSSLINRLLGTEEVRTGEISEYADRGKHVTTSRQMYFLESGAMVIDNPGIREVGLVDAGSGVDASFDEIALRAQRCKYADCTHTHEPGCAVRAAVESGELDDGKYSNYTTLKKEAEYYERDAVERREHDRTFGKFIKRTKADLKRLEDFGE